MKPLISPKTGIIIPVPDTPRPAHSFSAHGLPLDGDIEEYDTDTAHLNRLADQALELSKESRSIFLHRVEKKWPALHRRLQHLLTGLDTEVPPHFLQPDEFSAGAIKTLYFRLFSRNRR